MSINNNSSNSLIISVNLLSANSCWQNTMIFTFTKASQRYHDSLEHYRVTLYRQLSCLFTSFMRLTTTTKSIFWLLVIRVTGGFPTQRASNAESVLMSWPDHESFWSSHCLPLVAFTLDKSIFSQKPITMVIGIIISFGTRVHDHLHFFHYPHLVCIKPWM